MIASFCLLRFLYLGLLKAYRVQLAYRVTGNAKVKVKAVPISRA